MRTSCGIILTEGKRLLLCHVTGQAHWDIPKGGPDPGETHEAAAVRETLEETGLVVPPGSLRSMGIFPYYRGKQLALFAWETQRLPDISGCRCTSTFRRFDGAEIDEVDDFKYVAWTDVETYVTKNMARVLDAVRGHLRIEA